MTEKSLDEFEEEIEVVYTDDVNNGDDLWDATVGISPSNWEDDPFAKGVKDQRQLEGLSSGSKRSLTYKIKKRYEGQDGAKSKAKYREQLTGYDLWDLVPPIYNLEHLALLMEKSTVHHSAVAAKVASTVSTGFELGASEKTLEMQEQADHDDDEERMDFIRRKITRVKRRITEWLEEVNEEDDFVEVLEKWITDYESLGVAALEIGRRTDGQIGYIGHIPAQTIRPRKDRDGFVQIVNNEVTFFRNFGDTETPDPIGDDPQPNEIIYLKKYSPRTTYYGVPDVIPALNAIAGMEFAKQYNVDFFENKAVPKHMIVVKGGRLSDKAEKALIAFFHNNLKGQHHRAVLIPLPESLGPDAEIKIEQIESDIQDASFERYIDMGRDEVLMSHRVPITKIGVAEDIPLAVARDADRTFKEAVVNPLQRKVEKKINKIIKEITDIVVFKLNQLSLVDEKTQAEIDEVYLRNAVWNVNEVRTRQGKKSVESGDEYINVNAQPDIRADQRSQARAGRQREQEESRDGPDGNSSEGREPKT